ncbi:MAG: CDF family Co(II)/Ni(II) efflux transporter DmeF [Burkholderiales bacterium]|nr:CDF family Co(II)/Ni(II) efflux transporter DmeF [Burkholderiales bacterium]
MRTENLCPGFQEHAFHEASGAAERGTRAVTWITAATMVVEIAAGWWFNSMALLADGWHMSSHALAIGLSAFAYAAARRYARDRSFAFGTWKIEVLGGFASALLLLVVAVLMVAGSVERLIAAQPIHYPEAMLVAALGLAVNIVCAVILGRAGAHQHGGGAGHGHAHPAHAGEAHGRPHEHGKDARHHDLNLKSAYVHVLADALTSVLALAALAGGWLYGWGWLDPATGILGALLVAIWARGLLAASAKVLLDREMDHPLVDEILAMVDTDLAPGQTRITDLHVWRVGRRSYACVLGLLTSDADLTPARVRKLLSRNGEIAHSTIEIHRRG